MGDYSRASWAVLHDCVQKLVEKEDVFKAVPYKSEKSQQTEEE